MNTKTKNAILIIASVLVSVAFVNGIFWAFSVTEQALITTWSAILSACLANQWTWIMAKKDINAERY
ncbi:hypothetical protein OPS25_07165 [Alteromonas ponticola]|uniref:TMhelix containing protein n=1 Tax=Alteromonas aquimaris TaxID=2998417 RepID=A0ABT3P860_9ALTE|nr:hypothetical protein [Alteromonas aquimaris]MCW8108271.1 hypothetical protein [Alteromonas aquimaris]